MNSTCKFCGYRFKSKDEQICPECLTAREEDISCGVYGESEHSHVVFDEHNRNGQLFTKNDTFRDGRADFLKEELREEDRTNASRYEHRNGGDINMQADNKRSYVPRPANTPYSPSPNAYRPQNNMNNNTSRPSSGKGCGCLFVIIIAIVAIAIASNQHLFSEKLNELTQQLEERVEDSSDSKSGKIDVDNAEKIDLPNECDFEAYLTDVSKAEGMSDDEALDTFVKQSLLFVEDDTYVNSTEAEPRALYSVSPFIVLRYPDGKKLESDDLEIKDVECLGYDKDENILSVYYGTISDRMMVSVGENSTFSPKLYCDKNSEYIDVYFDCVYKGKDITFMVTL